MSLDGETSVIMKDKAERCDESLDSMEDKDDYERDAESPMSAEEGENDDDNNEEDYDVFRDTDRGIQNDCIENPVNADQFKVGVGETVEMDHPISSSSTHHTVEAPDSLSEG